MPSFYQLDAAAKDRYLSDTLNEPSERAIVNIVKNTIAPNVVTPKSVLREYNPIHPAIHGYSVHGGTSGRDERRVQNIEKRRVLKASVKAQRMENRRKKIENPKPSPEDYEIIEDDLRKLRVYWELPGGGPIGNPGECDTMHGSEACIDSERGRKIALSPKRWYCDRPTCPDCFEHWTDTTAQAVMGKIKAAQQLYSFYGARYRLCHVVISAPPDYAKFIGIRKGYDLLMEDFYRIADSFDMHGFLIFHPWRGKKDDDGDVTLYDGAEYEEDREDFWTLGPHAHLVAFCDPERIIESSAELYEATGFVTKVIAMDLSEIYAQNVISYALSHCGIGHCDNHKDLKAIHPFGYLATSKDQGLYLLHTVREEASKTCSECGGYIYDTRELDARFPEDELKKQIVPLYHKIYVRRGEKEGYKAMVLGMTDSQILEYARRSIYDMALIYDERPTIVEAKCDVGQLNRREAERVERWRPDKRRGQLLISPFRSSEPPSIRRGYL